MRWNACVHRLDLGLYSHPKEFFGGMELEPMLTPRDKPPLPENFPRGGLNQRRCGQRIQTLPTSYSGPRSCDTFTWLLSTKMEMPKSEGEWIKFVRTFYAMSIDQRWQWNIRKNLFCFLFYKRIKINLAVANLASCLLVVESLQVQSDLRNKGGLWSLQMINRLCLLFRQCLHLLSQMYYTCLRCCP